MPRHFACLFAFLATIVLAPGAIAADVKVMISAGFFSVYKELGPAFENSTGHKSSPLAGLRLAIRQKQFRRDYPVVRRRTS